MKRPVTRKRSPAKKRAKPAASTKRQRARPAAAAKRPPPSMRQELERAAAGLSYFSEADYPFQFFILPADSGFEMTREAFLGRLGLCVQAVEELSLPFDKLVEERAFGDFLPSAQDLAARDGTEASDAGVVKLSKRYRGLEAALKKHLRELKVFRVGRVEVRCYIAGLDRDGNIAGLVTTAIET